VELRHERAIGGVNCTCAPVEATLDGPRQHFIAIDGDDEQGGTFGFIGGRPRQGRKEFQRGQAPDGEVQFAVRSELLSEAVAEFLRAFA